MDVVAERRRIAGAIGFQPGVILGIFEDGGGMHGPGEGGRRMRNADGALEGQRLRPAVKGRDADVVAVAVRDAVQADRLRLDRQLDVEHALLGAFPRGQHHPVLTERDGLAVAVGGAMADGQQQKQFSGRR
jgi:hypothetical protein